MKIILLYALSLLAGFTMCAGEIVVHESPEWRPVSGAILKQYEEQGLRKDLVDAAYFVDGTYASVVKFSLSAENSADSFRNLIAGIMHAAEKQGFHSVKREIKDDAPFPRTVYLFEGTKNGAPKRILIYYVCDQATAYVFTIVGDQHLDSSSEIVLRYALRAAPTDLAVLRASVPNPRLEQAWREGEKNGEALIVICLLLIAALGFGFWKMRSAKRNDNKNQA